MSLPLGNLPDTRYPDPRIERLDPRFIYQQGNAAIERIATGFRWAEGPVYFRDGGLPGVQRHSQQPHDALAGGGRSPVGVPRAIQLCQRQHARPRGTPDHLRTRHAASDAH